MIMMVVIPAVTLSPAKSRRVVVVRAKENVVVIVGGVWFERRRQWMPVSLAKSTRFFPGSWETMAGIIIILYKREIVDSLLFQRQRMRG